ncbi:hypothetical protein A3G16_00725 [Candidatus Curtissbacteria bacterium RIFCSPLOWO2_12_FULL_41_16]|nr:MAG: hypothetical protein A3G16_00725 [Candidatus Curtissbacteria bacterium RIFCSPLOWO2_12_FULL_41_16]
MFPSQTSLIPITVALAKFTAANGFGGLYPYWYLGSTPVKYLTGPVVPGVLVGLHQLLPNFSLFDLSYFVILTSYFISAIGWGILSGRLSGSRMVGWWVGGLTFILPWHWVAGLGLEEVSAVLASALTPWVLWVFARGPVSSFLPAFGEARLRRPASARKTFVDVGIVKIVTVIKKKFLLRAVGNPSTAATPCEITQQVSSYFSVWLPSLAFALLLLSNTTASIPAIVGLLIISNFKLVSFSGEKQISNLKKAAIVIMLGWLLSLLWYGPNYWSTSFGAASIGGKSAVSAFVNLINQTRGFVPVILALVLVVWGFRPKTLYDKFILAWLTIFGSLTLFRFLADPDFWMDWTAWIGEVEVGLAMVMGRNFQFKIETSFRIANFKLKITRLTIFYLLFAIYFLAGWMVAFQNRNFWLPRASIENTVEYKIAKWLELGTGPVSRFPPAFGEARLRRPAIATRSVGAPTVFLSGTTAFWLNSLVDVRQVRGGRDEVSVNGDWRDAAWEIREGATGEGTERALRTLNISYVVVHTKDSGEFYHDFLYPQKFENISSLTKIYEKDGDVIYQVGD